MRVSKLDLEILKHERFPPGKLSLILIIWLERSQNQGGGGKVKEHVLNCSKMEAVPSDIFPYFYRFLLQNKLTKTAKCFKKEIGTVRVMILYFWNDQAIFNGV